MKLAGKLLTVGACLFAAALAVQVWNGLGPPTIQTTGQRRRVRQRIKPMDRSNENPEEAQGT